MRLWKKAMYRIDWIKREMHLFCLLICIHDYGSPHLVPVSRLEAKAYVSVCSHPISEDEFVNLNMSHLLKSQKLHSLISHIWNWKNKETSLSPIVHKIPWCIVFLLEHSKNWKSWICSSFHPRHAVIKHLKSIFFSRFTNTRHVDIEHLKNIPSLNSQIPPVINWDLGQALCSFIIKALKLIVPLSTIQKHPEGVLF